MQIANYGEQTDGSVIDLNGNIMTADNRIKICESVEALPASEKSIIQAIQDCTREWYDFIIDWATWSGKSTTVGSIIRGITGNSVIQTVPRVLAARWLWSRISDILLAQTWDPQFTIWKWEIWFRTWGGNSGNKIDMLSINTDWTQLRRMLQSWLYPDTLIIDEIQSKSTATDVLLQLAVERKEMQIWIMSATLDTEKIQDFLKKHGREAPIIKIPWKIFPIQEYYNPKQWSYDKILELAHAWKHTLVLVSWKGEIDEWVNKLSENLQWWFEIIWLHAELSENEQAYVIEPLEWDDITRVIVATNVAEESITIPYLDAVVDLGRHKVWVINSDGIWELRIEPAPLANTRQRRWRVGRTKPGEYHRHSNTPLEDLYEYSQAEIENSTLEQIILLYSYSEKDLRSMISEAKRTQIPLFLHEIDINLMNIWYKRLQRIWALDEAWNITELWRDILILWIDPFLWRMVIESIKRWCIEEMITICSIFSVNWFLSKDGNWDKLKTWSKKKSDFLWYIDILNLCTQKKLSPEMIGQLIYLWVEREELEEFERLNGEKELFQVVKLEVLWIKNHKIQEIQNMIYKLRERLNSNGIQVSKRKKITSHDIMQAFKDSTDITPKFDNIWICITAWYPFYQFRFDRELDRFVHDDSDGKRSKEKFKQASISMIEVLENSSFIGIPFILGPDEDNDLWNYELDTESFFDQDRPVKQDFALLSHITNIRDSYFKEALQTQSNYSSPVKWNKSPKKTPTARTLDDMQEEYIIAISDIQKWFSHEQFLYYTLPLFLITQNHRFKKLSRWKEPRYLEELYHRISRFLQHNKWDYIYRISNSFEDIEKSFLSDGDIFESFRTWEKKMVLERKKINNQGKKINKQTAWDIERKKNIFLEEKKYRETLWRFERANFDSEVKFDAKEERLTRGMFIYLDMKSRTFQKLREQYQIEIIPMNRAQRVKQIGKINASNNSKSQLKTFKTRISDINRFTSTLIALKDYCDHPSTENYAKIKDDFDYVENFILLNDKNREKHLLSSKSQQAKLSKGITAIKQHQFDNTGAKRHLRGIQSFSRGLAHFIESFTAEKVRLERKLQEQQIAIEYKRTHNLDLRTELAFFFQYLYNEEYYFQKIEPLLNDILIKILESEDMSFEEIIENCIKLSFDSSKLQRRLHTSELIDFLKWKKDFFNRLQKAQAIRGKLEKKSKEDTNPDDYKATNTLMQWEIEYLEKFRTKILA